MLGDTHHEPQVALNHFPTQIMVILFSTSASSASSCLLSPYVESCQKCGFQLFEEDIRHFVLMGIKTMTHLDIPGE
jgi:hypothetical protein